MKVSRVLKSDIPQRDIVASNKFFQNHNVFSNGVVSEDGMPDIFTPEVAICGRSNVGKSSIINGLTYSYGQKQKTRLAYTSKTPGKTRQLNFFSINRMIRIVDLPGYGYSKGPKSDVKNWSDLIANYMANRENLMRVFLLIDCRRGISEADEIIMDWLAGKELSYQIVLTKSDCLNEEELENIIKEIESFSQERMFMYPKIIVTSSLQKKGLEVMRYEIANLVRQY